MENTDNNGADFKTGIYKIVSRIYNPCLQEILSLKGAPRWTSAPFWEKGETFFVDVYLPDGTLRIAPTREPSGFFYDKSRILDSILPALVPVPKEELKVSEIFLQDQNNPTLLKYVLEYLLVRGELSPKSVFWALVSAKEKLVVRDMGKGAAPLARGKKSEEFPQVS
jgi:hypothetical protein